MTIRTLALGIVPVASLYGQSHFSWQDYCFKNLASPVCRGHEYATKPPPKEAPQRTVYSNPFPANRAPSGARTVAPTLIVVGAVDWRFADPFADMLVGINFNGLAASPLARSLIVQLGAQKGLTEADVQKLLDGLAGVEQVALSVHDNLVAVMITGGVTGSIPPPPEAGMKVAIVSGNSALVGHAAAVDQAQRRIAAKFPLGELARMAEERQASSEFWAIGTGRMAGPQAASVGVKLFSMTVSIRDRLTSDIAFEFNGPPSANLIRSLQTQLGSATIEGNALHVRASMEADELRRKFGEIAAGPLGEKLADLVEAARYLPARDLSVPKRTKPVIYGLEGGPREVN